MMEEYDEYEKLIKKISKYAFMMKIKPRIEYISEIYKVADNNIKDAINKAIEIRNQLGITKNDVSSFHIYLRSGCQLYSAYKNKESAFCVSVDVYRVVKRLSLINECKKYRDNDLLFLKYPSLKNLISNNQELINISKMKVCKNSRVLNDENIIVKMNNNINPYLISYLKNKYPNNVLFVRIDKDGYDENSIEFINEFILRSEQSSWYKKMLIYNNEKKLGEYACNETIVNLGCNKENADRIINKLSEDGYEENNKYLLQTLFKRDNRGLLSGSLEELEPIDSGNTLISKYIHLTSNSEIGTDWDDGVLAHIDGAINVYFDENAKNRLSQKLNEKVPSDCRTHLFRIDNIPITELLPISKLFFKSIALVEEWESDSFKNNI